VELLYASSEAEDTDNGGNDKHVFYHNEAPIKCGILEYKTESD
jgi:hypothetical protein